MLLGCFNASKWKMIYGHSFEMILRFFQSKMNWALNTREFHSFLPCELLMLAFVSVTLLLCPRQ